MVEGLRRFTKHFEGLEDAYVLIGGAACDLWLSERALPFRATKDLDVVIIVEAINDEFFTRFWKFIQAGQYDRRGYIAGAQNGYCATSYHFHALA